MFEIQPSVYPSQYEQKFRNNFWKNSAPSSGAVRTEN